jgi:HD-GYP domain-containing protein (c-di-GMP phosphodiesterase class II)
MTTTMPLPASLHESLSSSLHFIHERLAVIAPDVVRIACALYDEDEDMLKTFINSTTHGYAIRAYQYPLSDSEWLSYLARTKETRVIDDIPGTLDRDTPHTHYVVDQGYVSSFTVPMHYQGSFLGFVFFDSCVHGTFTGDLQRELVLYAQLLAASVASEYVTIRSIVGTIQVARDLTEFRDEETGEHLQRMARYSRIIARALVEQLDLTDEFVEAVFLYAPLHDLGKISIPDSVLLKAGPLTEEEWAIMRSHTVKGRVMVDTITRDLGMGALTDDTVLRSIVELHHEALDGSGYPHGLSGEQIPLEARIVTVADIFDALTSSRPYKEGWSVERAAAELRTLADRGKVDARCVEALLSQPDEIAAVMQRHPDTWAVGA